MVTKTLAGVAITWVGVIFWLLTTDDPPGYGARFGGLSKDVLAVIAHFGLFAVLAAILAVLNLTRQRAKRHIVRAVVIAVVLSAAYGGALESYQSTLPTRHASMLDTLVNTVGAGAGAISGTLFVHLLSLRRRAFATRRG